MTGRTNAASPAGGGAGEAEAITGKIPASSGFYKYSFNYTNINGELVKLSSPSAQEVEDVCKNSVVICSYNSMGSSPRTISSGGFLLAQGAIFLSSEASSLFDGDAAAAFFVTGDFEIT